MTAATCAQSIQRVPEGGKLPKEVNWDERLRRKELANAFRTVRKNTVQVAEDIPESQYGHVVAADAKSVYGLRTGLSTSLTSTGLDALFPTFTLGGPVIPTFQVPLCVALTAPETVVPERDTGTAWLAVLVTRSLGAKGNTSAIIVQK
jgi:hypothetical protein